MRSAVLPVPRCGQTAEAEAQNRQDKECTLQCPGYVALHNQPANILLHTAALFGRSF